MSISKKEQFLQLVKALFKAPELKIRPKFRVLRIEKTDDDEYIALVQVIHKNHVFRMKPEEILADDALTDSFLPRDIRTLTYLGYLGINSPKYTILAQRFKDNNQLVFALKDRHSKDILVKTSSEISEDEALINGLNQVDAHRVGFSTGSEHVFLESEQMKAALTTHNNHLSLMDTKES